jgi:predicted PurR-regulated permease PerM
MNDKLLTKSLKVLLLIVLVVVVLVYAKPFLVPLVFAGLFSMLLLPLSRRFENMGLPRGVAILFCVLIFVIIIGIVIYLLIWQVTDISKNASQIEQNLYLKLEDIKDYIATRFGLSRQRQAEIIQQQQQSSGGKVTNILSAFLSSLGSFLTNVILVVVYIFLLLYFRLHLKRFVLVQVQPANKKNAETIMQEGKAVAQKYITGIAYMIVCLWIMYGIGFSIVGVEHAIFFAILCGLLEIVPFIGNLTGSTITALSVIMQGGSTPMLVGVIVTYAIVQFLQTYILEPLVVGKGVSLNPLFTIAGIVAGNLIWGIPGMILAIPVLGITKIICDHVEPLKPYGMLLGDEDKGGKPVTVRVKQWLSRKVKS